MKAMGKASRAKAQSEFGVKAVVEKTLQIYEGGEQSSLRKAA